MPPVQPPMNTPNNLFIIINLYLKTTFATKLDRHIQDKMTLTTKQEPIL